MSLLRTPFYDFHVKHNAKMVDFAGWEMPLLYRSIHEEHRQVRSGAGIFDVSHMGRLKITGRHSRRLLESVLTRRISDMAELSCRYSLICNEQGGVLDDVIVYRFDDHWLLVVNASNRAKIVSHLQANLAQHVAAIEDITSDTAMIALQGPKVMSLIGQFSKEIPTLKRYHFCIKNYLVVKLIVSRTGYTGEDGVEAIVSARTAEMAMKLILSQANQAIEPTGLGARDTLRMEAGMPLYGHELSETIDPLSAGLNFAVSLDKDQQENGLPFIGQAALKKIAADGPRQKLVGLRLEGKRTARQNMAVYAGDMQVGSVTSGCLSPTLGYPIAMAYVVAEHSAVGAQLLVDLGGARTPAQVTPLPFYKKPA